MNLRHSIPILIFLLLFQQAVPAGLGAADKGKDPHLTLPRDAAPGDPLSPWIITLHGACGIALPWGSISGSGDQAILPGLAYGVILQGGYGIIDEGYITAGLAFTGKNLKTKRSLAGSEITSTVRTTFTEFTGGYRHQFTFLYLEGGLFFGLKTGTWQEVTETGGHRTIADLDGSMAQYCHNEFGLYTGAGYRYAWTEHFSLEAGLRFGISFLSAYDSVDNLKSTYIAFTAGASYRI